MRAGQQRPIAAHRGFQQQRRRDGQRHRAQARGHGRGQQGPDEGAQGAARRNEAEQAPPLFTGKAVHQHAPEDADNEQVINTDPDEKHPPDADRRDVIGDQSAKRQHRQRDQAIDQRHEANGRQPRHQRTEQRHHQQHHHERGGEQPLQFVGAALQPQGIAQRAYQVVAGEHAEMEGKTQHQRRSFGWPYLEPLQNDGHGSPPGASTVDRLHSERYQAKATFRPRAVNAAH
ncbi:hypothetical protein D3C87_1302460 [compost metagenome]